MKPHGNIPAWFHGAAGRLLIGGEDAVELAGAGTPLFVYDFGIVREKVASLRAALPPDVGIHYAMKANPLPAMVAAMAEITDAIDVASAGELQIALDAVRAERSRGTSDRRERSLDYARDERDRVSFAGPGKRDAELEAAIRADVTINLESAGEADRALGIADRLGVAPKLAVRVNPDFALKGSGMKMGGGASAFGIDAEAVPALVKRLIAAGADWRGFHIFAGSQALDSEAIAATQAATVALSGQLADAVGASPPLVNLGGGFGIPYFAGEQPVDIERIGAALGEMLDRRAAGLADSRFAVELGRWLVGECGVYLARVIDRKASRGETFLVTDGGLHHQLAASGNFGTVVRRNYPIAVANRFDAPADETVSVVGCLCTPLDRLGDRVELPCADVGDVIAIFMAGAYGATASPSAFLGHGPARELLLGV